MKIYIPTNGRPRHQITLKELNESGMPMDNVSLVVRDNEAKDYYGTAELVDCCVILTPNYLRMSGARDFIVAHHLLHFPDDPCIIQIDDDCRFYKRRSEDPYEPGLRKLEGHEYMQLFNWCEEQILLSGYAHCSVATREQNFQASAKGEWTQETVRYTRLLVHNALTLQEHNLKFTMGMCESMGDFHMALSLFELGYPNIVSNRYAHNHTSSNTPGGCSEYRTLDTVREAAIALQQRHPDFVKLEEKSTETSWGGKKGAPAIRTDVRCQWKKSLGSKFNANPKA